MFRAPCAHRQEAKIVLYSLWYHHTETCFIMSLFHASTCFEHHVLIVRRAKLYYTVSGIITPMGGRPVHRLRASPLSTRTPDGHL